mmetsp:Transcript_54478/g.128580  ORF Transcript_54478/g.128580 Transcript_54478/m.128580 type:complete len:113 (+) Transcript_54478:118-456(+)
MAAESGSRAAVLALYRSLLRAAKSVPTENQSSMALNRIRDGFRKGRDVTNEEDIRQRILIAHTGLDSLQVQAAHQKRLAKMKVPRPEERFQGGPMMAMDNTWMAPESFDDVR